MATTIWDKIEKAVNDAEIEGLKYERGYPCDYVRFTKSNDEILDDEGFDTFTPLTKAMRVIMDVVEKNATIEDDIVVTFCHHPFDEIWGIEIGDGR